jgi:hypothetical protein
LSSIGFVCDIVTALKRKGNPAKDKSAERGEKTALPYLGHAKTNSSRPFLKQAKENIIAILPLAVAALLTMSAFLYFNASIPKDQLRDNIRDIEPIFLLANFAIILFALFFNATSIRQSLSKVSPRTWIMLAVIIIAAFSLRNYVAPHTHRVFFDEDIYVELGQDILVRGKGALCNYGVGAVCNEYDLMKWPNGYPFLLTAVFLFAGISEAVAFNLTVILGTLTVVLSFVAAYYLTKNERTALFASLLLALLPLHVMWSGTTAAEPIMAFFGMLATCCFLYSFEAQDAKSKLLAFSVLAYAVQIKSEGILFLPIFGLMVILLDRKFFKTITDRKVLAIWCMMFLLITPYLTHMKHAFDNDNWGANDGDKMGLSFFFTNLPINAGYYISGYRTIEHPMLFTALAFLGGAYLLIKDKRSGTFLALWFFGFFLMYCSFYAGSVLYGVDVRYQLNCYMPFILMAAAGANLLTDVPASIATSRFGKDGYKEVVSSAIALLMVVFIMLSFYAILPTVSTPAAKIEEARQARDYHQFALEVSNRLAPNCYILSHVPSIYLPLGKISLQTWNGQNTNVMNDIFTKTDCVVFDDGYWCNVDPYKTSVCKSMFDNYDLQYIDSLAEDNGHEYTFYYVSQK